MTSIDINSVGSPELNSPTSVLVQDTREMHVYNMENLDISSLAAIKSTADYVKDHFSQCNHADVTILKLKLEIRIIKIEGETKGILNWLKYFLTFRLSKRRDQLDQVREMENLRSFLVNCIRATQPQGPLTSISIEDPINPIDSPASSILSLMTDSVVPIRLTTDPSKNAPTSTPKASLKKPAATDPLTSPQKTFVDNTTPQVVLSPLLPSSEDPSGEGIPPAPPPMDDVPVAPPLDGNIPPPPDGDISAFTAPPQPARAKKFANEPLIPSHINSDATGIALKKMSKEQLVKEIKDIETFIVEFEKAMSPIQAALQEEARLTNVLKDRRKEIDAIDKRLQYYEKLKKALSEERAISLITQQDKGGQVLAKKKYPLYSDEEFTKKNIARANQRPKPKPPLPIKHLRSHQIKHVTAKETEARQARTPLNKSLIADTEKLEAFARLQNNGIPFNEYTEVLGERNKILSKWKSALNLRRKKLEGLTKPSEPTDLEVIRPTPAAAAQQPRALRLEEDAEFEALQQDQAAVILMRGEGYLERMAIDEDDEASE